MIRGKPFDPRTFTSRRPTPEKFTHDRNWIAAVVQNIMMTSIEEITNINSQIEQVGRFYISSIIQRVISQLTAQYGDGFKTLKCTEDGHLIVQNEREAKAVTSAAINCAALGDNIIVAGVAGQQIKITGLIFTVGGETNLKLMAGAVDLTGPMDFGGADEPRGIVDSQGFLPLELPAGESFIVNLSIAVQVSGYVTGYIE